MALDILQTLVRAYGVVSNNKSGENPTIQSRPLSQILVVNAFPAAVKCTLRSDDNAVTQVSSTILSFIGCKIMHSVTVSRKIVIFLENSLHCLPSASNFFICEWNFMKIF